MPFSSRTHKDNRRELAIRRKLEAKLITQQYRRWMNPRPHANLKPCSGYPMQDGELPEAASNVGSSAAFYRSGLRCAGAMLLRRLEDPRHIAGTVNMFKKGNDTYDLV